MTYPTPSNIDVLSRRNAEESRFIIGIDLGTSNCALSYIDTYSKAPVRQDLSILQWDDEDQMISHEILPSFLYIPTKSEIKRHKYSIGPTEASDAPQKTYLIGRAARHFSLTATPRVVHSAKSWLCHGGVNRTEAILPWHSEEIIGSDRLTPVEASAQYLRYLALRWDETMAQQFDHGRFRDQIITITVPASFDELAQALTLEAALLAGYPDSVRLLEEPQAAFYDWMYGESGDWKKQIRGLLTRIEKESADILVCDIGGGTSDFSILRIQRKLEKSLSKSDPDSISPETESDLIVERVLVSEHLLLGGDNIDLTIAHKLDQQRNDSQSLDATAWASLVSQSRILKESILEGLEQEVQGDETYHVTWQSPNEVGSSSLFTAGHSLEIKKSEILELIISGFFPDCEKHAKPISPNKEHNVSGLSEWNLPYAADSAITHHLAGFLSRHDANIDGILFAGGTMNPSFLRKRIADLISRWQNNKVEIVETNNLSRAVARGATAYSYLQPRFRKSMLETYPRDVFLEVEGEREKQLIKIIEKNSPIGQQFDIKERLFEALINQKVEISIYTSSYDNKLMALYDTLPISEIKNLKGIHRLPKLQTSLDIKSNSWDKDNELPTSLSVKLRAEITVTGLLALSCVSQQYPNLRWNFQFQLNDQNSQKDTSDTSNRESALKLSADHMSEASQILNDCFGKKKAIRKSLESDQLKDIKPQFITNKLEELISPRDQWDILVTRGLWDLLSIGLNRRNRSEAHEHAWLYLAGFCLRPGYGHPNDDQRIETLWQIFQQGPSHPQSLKIQEQWWIMWRRIAGGLSPHQHSMILDKIMPSIRKSNNEGQEIIRLAGALERADMKRKIQLANLLCKQICSGQKQNLDAKIWALARVVSRLPLFSGPEVIVRPGFVKGYFEQLLKLDLQSKHYKRLSAVFIHGGRMINSRDFDIDADCRNNVEKALKKAGFTAENLRPLTSFVKPDESTYIELFGEQLPAGLKILK